MAGNHLKRCALMRWRFSILNDDTKYLVWWVNNRNTEAKKARPKSCFSKNGWNRFGLRLGAPTFGRVINKGWGNNGQSYPRAGFHPERKKSLRTFHNCKRRKCKRRKACVINHFSKLMTVVIPHPKQSCTWGAGGGINVKLWLCLRDILGML